MMLCYLNNDGHSQLDTCIQYNIKPEWFNDDLIREAMRDIEHVYKIEGLAFYSSDFGVKSPQSLSNGMKALLLMKYLPIDHAFYQHGFYVSNASIGDNVVPFLQRLSVQQDFPIANDIFLPFSFDMPLKAKDMETGKILNNTAEFVEFYAGRYCI